MIMPRPGGGWFGARSPAPSPSCAAAPTAGAHCSAPLPRRSRARSAGSVRSSLGRQPRYGRPNEQKAGVLMARLTNRDHAAAADAEGPARRRPLKWQDIRGDARRRADELLCTEAEAATLEALRVATAETDGDMERHTVRQYLIAERLADTRGIRFGRELLLCASFLHDAGRYGPAPARGAIGGGGGLLWAPSFRQGAGGRAPASTGDGYTRIPPATRVVRSSHSGGRRIGWGYASTPASSTTPSHRGGRWATR